VMLKPHVDLLDESNGFWRGDIGDGFTTEAQWSAWFAAYRSFIEHYAQLAKDNGADQFCVGTELLGTTRRRPADWRAVVADVRTIYPGPLVYAALKEGEETSITWWDAVDYIGVDGYYQLTSDIAHDPSETELAGLWDPHVATLAQLSASNGNKPILLTEVGYRSQHGCCNHPWDSEIESSVDLEEQAFAYQATFEKLYNQPWLAGMFWWYWSPDRFTSGPCDDSYSPHQKPAEDILRTWYGAAPLPPPSTLVPDPAHTLGIYSDGLASGWQNWSWDTTRFDPAATDQKFSGATSLAVTLKPWGAVSLYHSAFDAGQYYWLEFYIYASPAGEPQLKAFFDAQDGTLLDRIPVNDCRHIQGGTIDAGVWKLVRIPLSDLNRQGKSLIKVTIQDQGQGSSFWIDNLRLIAGAAPAATSTSTPPPTATPSAQPPTGTPTVTRTPTATSTRTPTPPRTATPTALATPSAQPPTGTPTRLPTATSTRTPAPPPTAAPTATSTATKTPTPAACSAKPARPTLVSPANGSTAATKQVALDWRDVTCATLFEVQVRRDSTRGTLVDNPKALAASQYTTVALTAGRTYYWAVRACNAIGCSAWTSYRRFKVSSSAK
jgi:hypothetical protein